MPRKPKLEKKTITVVVNGTPISVTLHPPTGARRSWYAYTGGWLTSRSTGQRTLEDAIVTAEQMVRGKGHRAKLTDAVLSDEEFEAIQRAHFERHQDPAARERAAKTLNVCLEAIAAFRLISELNPITAATADDCAAFQREALNRPKNWRKQYPRGKKEVACVSANTVLKWSRALAAAWERANRTSGKKCVRGVVEDEKLLSGNPWRQFKWVGGTERPIRQFDGEELLSFLDYLEDRWRGVTVAGALAKTCLWSQGRRTEVTGLRWSSLRAVGHEYHFEIVGKAGIEKWFRVPEGLYQELLALKADSPYVFAAYSQQMRHFYESSRFPWQARVVCEEFRPVNLGDWFHERIVQWSKSLPRGHATAHVFRKSSLQYARTGEDVNRQVADDARVSPGVMMTHYVKETDEQMRARSNRTFARILAGLPAEVARRYGHVDPTSSPLEERLRAALADEDWPLVARLSSELARRTQATVG
jgi:hypothetical protein